jgi:toxin ParE1/3/4
MGKRIRKVVYSDYYILDLENIFKFGNETFDLLAAQSFLEDLFLKTENLTLDPELYPECRYLRTKTKIYRNIIVGSYLIIYRITKNRIEVLRAFHSSRNIRNIKSSEVLRCSLHAFPIRDALRHESSPLA